MSVRVVVADESSAQFYDVAAADDPRRQHWVLQPAGQLSDPGAHLHDRDLKSDRPGRVFDHAPAASGRRGATAHHGTGGERRPRVQLARRFARRIADELSSAHEQAGFERLVLVAPPRFLGLLRQALPFALQTLVVKQIHKDLVHQPSAALQAQLSREWSLEPLHR